jgi:Mce-associated membrane protein
VTRPWARRASWWTLVTVLIAATAVAASLATRQLVAESKTIIADGSAERNAELDVAKADVPRLLSYTPDTAEHDLTAATSLLTGAFLTNYTNLIHDTVIPGAQQKIISATAQVPADAVETLTSDKA